MKRITAFIISLIMCIGLLSTFAVSASTGVEYIYRENFNNMKYVPKQVDCGGLKTFNGYQNSTFINDGKLEFTSSGGQAFADIQLWASDIVRLKEDFTLSMRVKLTGDWLPVDQTFIRFSCSRPESNGAKSEMHEYLKFRKGALVMTTDFGASVSNELTCAEYATVELAFNERNGVYVTVEAYVNGEFLGEQLLKDENLTSIDHFRMFTSYTKDVGISLDSFAIVKGIRSIHGVEIPDSPAQSVPEIHRLPNSDGYLRTEIEDIYYEGFDGITAENINTVSSGITEDNCFWLSDEGDTTLWSVTENGTLKVSGASFVDLQFLKNSKFDLREDFVFSLKFKPLSSCISGLIVEGIRGEAEDNSWDTSCRVELIDGYLTFGGKNFGYFPVNEWVYVELAYDYSEEENEFTSVKLILNGETVDEQTCNKSAELSRVSMFRLFRNFDKKEMFEVDAVRLMLGKASVIHLHSWDKGEITVPATHLSDGVKTYTCAECGATTSEAVFKAKEHEYAAWESADANSHRRVCACGKEEYAPHTFDGENDASCDGCGYECALPEKKGCGAVASAALVPMCFAVVLPLLLKKKR